MSHESERRAKRIQVSTRARIRGLCGEFSAVARDISLTGVRIRVLREELRLALDADLATAAATVQTRVGSRCVLELGLRQMSRPLGKKADLVRLVLPGAHPDSLDLGFRFEEQLSDQECTALRVSLPVAEPPRHVRNELSWGDEQRPRLDPALTEEKVEALFDVETAALRDHDERSPNRPLRVVLSAVEGAAIGPLVGRAESLSVNTILIRVPGDVVDGWLVGRRDLSEVAQAVKHEYGTWPELEITEGARRLWRGGASVVGLEVGEVGDRDVFLRLAFGRRLRSQELERICKAA